MSKTYFVPDGKLAGALLSLGSELLLSSFDDSIWVHLAEGVIK